MEKHICKEHVVACGGCGKKKYCSEPCLISDWIKHVKECDASLLVGAESALDKRVSIFPETNDDIIMNTKEQSRQQEEKIPFRTRRKPTISQKQRQIPARVKTFIKELETLDSSMQKHTLEFEKEIIKMLKSNNISDSKIESMISSLRSASKGLQNSIFPNLESSLSTKERQKNVANYLETSQKVFDDLVSETEGKDRLVSLQIEKEEAFIDYISDHIIHYIELENNAEEFIGVEISTKEEFRNHINALKRKAIELAKANYKGDLNESQTIRKESFSSGEHLHTRLVQNINSKVSKKDEKVQFYVWRYITGMLSVGLLGGALYVAGRYVSLDNIKDALFGKSEDSKVLINEINSKFYGSASKILGKEIEEKLRLSISDTDINVIINDAQKELAFAKEFHKSLLLEQLNDQNIKETVGDKITDITERLNKDVIIQTELSEAASKIGVLHNKDIFGSIDLNIFPNIDDKFRIRFIYGTNKQSALGILNATEDFIKIILNKNGQLSTTKEITDFFNVLSEAKQKLYSSRGGMSIKDFEKIFKTVWDTTHSIRLPSIILRGLYLFQRSIYDAAHIQDLQTKDFVSAIETVKKGLEKKLDIISTPIEKIIEDNLPIEEILSKLSESSNASILTSTVQDEFVTYHPFSRALMEWCSKQGFLGHMMGMRAAQTMIGDVLSLLNVFEGQIHNGIKNIYNFFVSNGLSSIFGYIGSILFNWTFSYALFGMGNIAVMLGLNGVSSLASLLVKTGEIFTTLFMKLFAVFGYTSEEKIAKVKDYFGGLIDSIKIFTDYTRGGLFIVHFISQIIELSTILYAIYGSVISTFVASNLEAVAGVSIAISIISITALWSRGTSMKRYLGSLFARGPLVHIGAVIGTAMLIKYLSSEGGVKGINLWEKLTNYSKIQLDNLFVPENAETLIIAAWKPDVLKKEIIEYMELSGLKTVNIPSGSGIRIDVDKMSNVLRELL